VVAGEASLPLNDLKYPLEHYYMRAETHSKHADFVGGFTDCAGLCRFSRAFLTEAKARKKVRENWHNILMMSLSTI
jgi:hypothetical protein